MVLKVLLRRLQRLAELIFRGKIASDVPLENVEAMLDEMTHCKSSK